MGEVGMFSFLWKCVKEERDEERNEGSKKKL